MFESASGRYAGARVQLENAGMLTQGQSGTLGMHLRSMQVPDHALPKEGKQDLRLRCHYPLGILWRMDRVRYARGEGEMKRGRFAHGVSLGA